MFLFRRKKKKAPVEQQASKDGAGNGSAADDESVESSDISSELEKRTSQEHSRGTDRRKASEDTVLPPPTTVLRQITAELGQTEVRDYVQDWGLAMSEEDITLATVATTVSRMVSDVAQMVESCLNDERRRAECEMVVKSSLSTVVLQVARDVAQQTQEHREVSKGDSNTAQATPSADGKKSKGKPVQTRRNLFSLAGSDSDEDDTPAREQVRPAPQDRAANHGVSKRSPDEAQPVYSKARLQLPTAETIEAFESNGSRSSHSPARGSGRATPISENRSLSHDGSPSREATPVKDVTSPQRLNGSMTSFATSPGANQTLGMMSTILDADSGSEIQEPSALREVQVHTPKRPDATGAHTHEPRNENSWASLASNRTSTSKGLSGQLADDEASGPAASQKRFASAAGSAFREPSTGRGRYQRAVAEAARMVRAREPEGEETASPSLLERSVEPRVHASLGPASDSDDDAELLPTQQEIDAREEREQAVLQEVRRWRAVRQRVAAALSDSDEEDAPVLRDGKLIVQQRVAAVFQGGRRQRGGSPGFSQAESSDAEERRRRGEGRRPPMRESIAQRVRRLSLSEDEEERLGLRRPPPPPPASDSDSD